MGYYCSVEWAAPIRAQDNPLAPSACAYADNPALQL